MMMMVTTEVALSLIIYFVLVGRVVDDVLLKDCENVFLALNNKQNVKVIS